MRYLDFLPLRHAAAIVLLTCLGSLVNTGFAQGGRDTLAGARALYVDYGCFQCHGYEGQGSTASPPVPRIAPTAYPFEAFAAFVRTPPNIMPAYSPNVLSDVQLREIYDYVRSVPEPPEVEDIPVLRDLL